MSYYGGGYNQGGGYDQGGYNQGGYNQGGGYDQGGYNQGGYNQGGGYGGSNDFDFDENMDVSEIARRMLGSDSNADAFSNLSVPEVSARDIDGFDPDEMEREFRAFEEAGGDGSRGIFGFGNGPGQSKKSHQLIAGAAAWSALDWFQTKQRNEGKSVNHSFLKKLLVGFAAAKAIKYWEKSGGLQSGMPRELVVEQATRSASALADNKFADDSQPQYSYNVVGGGEASSFDGPQSGGGYNQGGYNQGGYNQGGYNQGGYNQGGYNQGGYGGGY